MSGARFKVGDLVAPRWFVSGYPVGLPVDAMCRVAEVRRKDRRLRVERDDGRPGSWWLDFDATRLWGAA